MVYNCTKRTIFFISDSTGITVEALGLCLLSHFEGVTMRQVRMPFVDSEQKAREAVEIINATQAKDGVRAILCMTIVNPSIRALFQLTGGMCLDMFGTFVNPLSSELGMPANETIGMSRNVGGSEYRDRIEAINFTLGHDDGISDNGLQEAEAILVGVSRSGKTPASLYMAMQFGIRTANYPIIPEDLERDTLPGTLANHRDKIFGLTIDPERLHKIRTERRPNSRYASLDNCKEEVRMAEVMMHREGINMIDSTSRSVEEISSMIVQQLTMRQNKRLVGY
ncbi:kinase/pyrophosphorylase [Pseudomethylobacillus aquaticus]|uniref:Putative phosphoenolpyruvate synthase regulatory protein n=1 Tax=Pseudomethylobacillus aquaticus TaxID=2676064 RepID=A0A3N0V6C7_9PROT|nr:MULTISPECIES: pyruvate, water dikinase regulatory protein [Methylophilaceae]ROH88346.1 kinase/pyrophosphorylase [Pseudomethylobacillus aquaticus]